MLNELRDEIYTDAVEHGLWEGECSLQDCIELIIDEVSELEDAAMDFTEADLGKMQHFREEMADVLIMTLSVCGKLGIDIDAEVQDDD